jgi:zinc/manganese transport system substrate-binding protein
MKKIAWLAGAFALVAAGPLSAQTTVPALSIVAAENFYGDIASQLAAPDARIDSILSNPDDDPHMFEASPSVARALSGAKIVIYNGADYDPWMEKLLAAAKSADRQVIVVGDIVHKHAGDNPHLWYDTANAAAAAKALSAALVAADPARKPLYDTRLQTFLASLAPIDAKVAAMRASYHGTPVTATEPVFGYMASALGLTMRNERFQIAVMNDTEPAASDVAAFEGDLRHHKVRVLLYNSQATDESAKRLMGIAQQSHIPVVGVTETEPQGKTYQAWMTAELDALASALAKPGS